MRTKPYQISRLARVKIKNHVFIINKLIYFRKNALTIWYRLMIMFKKILVPYDGSVYSQHAFKTALEIAIKFQSEIISITCLFNDSENQLSCISEHAKTIDHTDNHTTNQLHELQKISLSNKIKTTIHIMSCYSVVETLTNFANSNKIDLIVMGTRGKTGFKPLILGSVSIGVSQHATCPILLVK